MQRTLSQECEYNIALLAVALALGLEVLGGVVVCLLPHRLIVHLYVRVPMTTSPHLGALPPFWWLTLGTVCSIAWTSIVVLTQLRVSDVLVCK